MTRSGRIALCVAIGIMGLAFLAGCETLPDAAADAGAGLKDLFGGKLTPSERLRLARMRAKDLPGCDDKTYAEMIRLMEDMEEQTNNDTVAVLLGGTDELSNAADRKTIARDNAHMMREVDRKDVREALRQLREFNRTRRELLRERGGAQTR